MTGEMKRYGDCRYSFTPIAIGYLLQILVLLRELGDIFRSSQLFLSELYSRPTYR